MDALISSLPPEVFGFALTLGLSLLIGFEREEHEPDGIGGVRTFPILGLGGFLLIAGFPDTAVPFALGLVVMGGLVAMSHWFSLKQGEPGITTEAAALLTFTIGGCAPIAHDMELPIVIDVSLKRFDALFAAAGHPHCVFPTTMKELKRLTGGIVSYNIAEPK